ncbi:MAG: hypothetical protein E6H95_06060 [Chloroflexi bacterium]|nr:MAG: hypothetical protein E6H95_06060 [Chloroflexota bacterium]
MSSGPVAGRGQQSPWLRPLAWLWAKKAWISAAVGALLIATTLYVLWAIKDLPDPSQNVLAAGDVMVLDRNGKLIEDWSPAGHYHVTLQLKEMGPYAPKAVLAAEDRNFYNHGAIDPMSTARAAWVDITSGGLHQGGSTITQQLVKIQLLTPQKSVTRKVQEIVLAIALEQRYSKDQILSMYLNRVYFGRISTRTRRTFPRQRRLFSLGWSRLPRRTTRRSITSSRMSASSTSSRAWCRPAP